MKIIIVSIVAALAGCVEEAGPVELGIAPPFVLQEVQDPNGRPVLVSDDLNSDPIELTRSVCICTDNACANEAIEETFGCGTCLTVTCDDGRHVDSCVPCPDGVERTNR